VKARRAVPDFLSSADPNFRPVAVNVGPDGAVYLADWHSPIISHTLVNHLRDPHRGPEYGRIYRVTHEGRPLTTPPKIHGQPILALLELLKEPENQVRELAKLELDQRDSNVVIAAVRAWAAKLDRRHPDYEHHRLEALWVQQWHNAVDAELLRAVAVGADPRGPRANRDASRHDGFGARPHWLSWRLPARRAPPTYCSSWPAKMEN